MVRQIEPIKGDLFKGIAAKKSASVNPDKNGLLFSVQRFRRPDIQILAVLTLEFQHVQASVVGERIGRQDLHRNRPMPWAP